MRSPGPPFEGELPGPGGDGGAGKTVRRRLPEQCGVHILLRLRWDLLRRPRQDERAVLRPQATGDRREPTRANYHRTRPTEDRRHMIRDGLELRGTSSG